MATDLLNVLLLLRLCLLGFRTSVWIEYCAITVTVASAAATAATHTEGQQPCFSDLGS